VVKAQEQGTCPKMIGWTWPFALGWLRAKGWGHVPKCGPALG